MDISAKRDEFQTFTIDGTDATLSIEAKNGKLNELQLFNRHGEALISLQGAENISFLMQAVVKFLTDRTFRRSVE